MAAASDRLDATTPCDEWDLRTLLNNMLETQQYFLSSARGDRRVSDEGQQREEANADGDERDRDEVPGRS